MLFLIDGIIRHTEEFVLIQNHMFITKRSQKSEIIENPKTQNKYKAIQLELMQRNQLINEVNVGKTDIVIQTDPTNIERDIDKADRMVQTNPTKFEEKQFEASSDDSEKDQIVTKN